MIFENPPALPVPIAGLVKHIAQHPDTPMMELLEPYRKFEAHLRQVFAQDPDNELVKDPYVNVLPLFTDDTPSIKSIKEFQRNFNIFSESSLSELDWSNVVAAGSSVVNTLLPVPEKYGRTKRGLREFYHEKFAPASDVDLFLYGLTEEQAIEKIKAIEATVRDALLTEITVVRTKHAITICSQYPTRHIQIVLRIYKSISEILTGFDIDCSGAAYDGKQVYCTPRALQSYMTQINHIDLSRRSPSYENRLSKYSRKGFEVYFPELDRSRIDPTVFERSFRGTVGLARLLVLERLPTQGARDSYQSKRRMEKGRPPLNHRHRQIPALRGDIKWDHEDEVADWFMEEDVSDYHTFTLPYGPRFNAKKIEKLCYTRDLLLNAEWNQHNHEREVYLHPEEKEVAQQDEKVFVSGKITFMKDDPGRQQIGSFNPLTDDDWTEMAYVGNTARLCQAIVDQDLEQVVHWLAQEGANPNTRDYTGRTPLHLACMASSPAIVQALVDAGARLVARLADGRTALHLAAARGDLDIVKILLDKSVANEAEYEEKKRQRRKQEDSKDIDCSETEAEVAEGADESDGELVDGSDSEAEGRSMATGSFVKVKREEGAPTDGAASDDNEDEPDFYDINVTAWDTPCSALHLAVMNGHVHVVQALVQDYGADVLLPVKFNENDALLTLVLVLALPIEKAKEMAKTLVGLGATSAQAVVSGITAFHLYAVANAESLLDTIWETDPTGTKTAINHLGFPSQWSCDSPLQAAVRNGNLSLVAKLLKQGAAPQVDFEQWLKSAKQSSSIANRLRTLQDNEMTFKTMVEQPLILALKSSKPEIAIELLEHGADPNVIPKETQQFLTPNLLYAPLVEGRCPLDLVDHYIRTLRASRNERSTRPTLPEGIDSYLDQFEEGTYQHWVVSQDIEWHRESYKRQLKELEKEQTRPCLVLAMERKEAALAEATERLEKIKGVLLAKGAKTFSELYPDLKTSGAAEINWRPSTTSEDKLEGYTFTFRFHNVSDVTETRQRFTAALNGDLETIKALTLASWTSDDGKDEAPLKIAVYDQSSNNPFSLAYSRGHYDVAKAILEIAHAQYSPEDKSKRRYTMDDPNDDDDDDNASTGSDGGRPTIYSQIVDDVFTIENVGEVSMQVNSRTKPLEMVNWLAIRHKGVRHRRHASSLRAAILDNDMEKLRFLLDICEHWSAQALDVEDEASGFYTFPVDDFKAAVEGGHVELLSEIIRRTGAGLPLESMVKNTGVELEVKPRWYRGLTVYGKKRKDWARPGRGGIVRLSGTLTSPLLIAAFAGRIEMVEWFLSDAPKKHYLAFANSKGARDDARLKHLAQAPGGIEGVISEWLSNQSELVLHAAIYARPSQRATELVAYLVKSRPALLHVRAANGVTPLLLAYHLGRLDAARILIEAGADEQTRDHGRNNLLHAALSFTPKARQLRPLLDLLDRETLAPMLKERNRLAEGGQTPLHQYICSVISWSGKAAKDVIRIIKTLIDLSPQDARQAFRMLSGSGDTPLHMLLLKGADPAIVRAVVDFDPGLLYVENAVGRTPAEVAHDCYLAEFVKNSRAWPHNEPDRWALWLAAASPPELALPKKACDGRREHEAATNVARNWRFCAAVLARTGCPRPARTLVTLDSANLVAKRLARQQVHDRYSFRLVEKKSGQDQPAESEEDDSSDGSDRSRRLRRRHRLMDEVTLRYGDKNHAWLRPEEEEEKEEEAEKKKGDDEAGESESGACDGTADDEHEDDGLIPLCSSCGTRHYP
ncbi:hypothetical protein VTH06DRAFT_8021 [Thermothelomyces fergusii]